MASSILPPTSALSETVFDTEAIMLEAIGVLQWGLPEQSDAVCGAHSLMIDCHESLGRMGKAVAEVVETQSAKLAMVLGILHLAVNQEESAGLWGVIRLVEMAKQTIDDGVGAALRREPVNA